MLAKMIIGNDLKKSRIIYIIMGFVFLILGIASITMRMLSNAPSLNDFIDGFFMGTGAGLVIVGLVFVVYYGLILNNPNKRKKAEIDAKDERNQFIKMKAGFISFVVSFGIQYVALIVSGLMNIIAFYTILAVIGVELLTVPIIWLIVKKTN